MGDGVLVTGGAGFIGSHLCDELLATGFSVSCVDNFSDYYSPQRKRSNISGCIRSKCFSLYEADILDFEKLKSVFAREKPSIVVHLAASVGVRNSITDPQKYVDVNVKGTANVLELCRQYGVKKFIFGSSSSVYGNNSKVPFSESDPVDSPASVYAATKRSGELLCKSYNNLYGISCVCLRFFTVYGPRGRPDMAPYKFTDLISRGRPIDVYGDGSSGRDYTYVADIVSGILAAVKGEFSFEIFNLGNSGVVKLAGLISLIEAAAGKKAAISRLPLQKGDMLLTCADISKARQLLKWQPKTGIEEGVRNLVEWYRQL